MSKVGSSTPKEKPRLKRHGFAGWLETTLGSCFCGRHKWYASIHGTTYDGSAHNVEINYPGCHSCFGMRSSQRAHTVYGQYTNDKSDKVSRRDLHTHEECREALCWTIALVVGKRPELEPGIEAYMYNGANCLRIWPHLANDYHWNCVTYWPEDGTIRKHDDGTILIKFPSKTKKEWDVDHFVGGDCTDTSHHHFAVEISDCYAEYLKSHNHRQPMLDARGWLAWLLGEALMDRQAKDYPSSPQGPPPNLVGRRLDAIVQPGIWQPVQA